MSRPPSAPTPLLYARMLVRQRRRLLTRTGPGASAARIAAARRQLEAAQAVLDIVEAHFAPTSETRA